jgi:RNA polymerase sigma-70 factor (ECF subfamily)
MIGADEAEEVTQDVFVRAWEKLETFRGESAFGTWLYRVAINVALARRQQLGVRRARMHDDDSVLETVASPHREGGMGVDFERAIEKLPEGARHVFVLHDVQGFRHDEIAQMMGVTSGTTKAQLHRARMMLRRSLTR